MTVLDRKIEALDKITYELQGVIAGLAGIKSRLVNEWIMGEPAGKQYGCPPKILSKPLTPELVNMSLDAQKKWLSDQANKLNEISFEVGDKDASASD